MKHLATNHELGCFGKDVEANHRPPSALTSTKTLRPLKNRPTLYRTASAFFTGQVEQCRFAAFTAGPPHYDTVPGSN